MPNTTQPVLQEQLTQHNNQTHTSLQTTQTPPKPHEYSRINKTHLGKLTKPPSHQSLAFPVSHSKSRIRRGGISQQERSATKQKGCKDIRGARGITKLRILPTPNPECITILHDCPSPGSGVPIPPKDSARRATGREIPRRPALRAASTHEIRRTCRSGPQLLQPFPRAVCDWLVEGSETAVACGEVSRDTCGTTDAEIMMAFLFASERGIGRLDASGRTGSHLPPTEQLAFILGFPNNSSERTMMLAGAGWILDGCASIEGSTSRTCSFIMCVMPPFS